MKEVILERLHKFERDKKVKVILAVESGSRGWGFASEDSDYDVRFVYVHPPDRYLDLNYPTLSYDWIEGEVDYEGFDIHKFYDLLLKSNMNIIDWLMQDVIYISDIKYKEELKVVVSKYFDRRTYCAHNYGLCAKNYHKYFVSHTSNEPTAKRYVYCIRSLLSAKYCDENNELAPLKFEDLIDETLKTNDAIEIRGMLEVKKNSKEKTSYHNGKWLKWIEDTMKAKINHKEPSSRSRSVYYNKLNSHMKEQIETTKVTI